MKILILLIIPIIYIVYKASGSLFAANTEKQLFKTLLKEGSFEIRYYPKSIMASVTVKGSYDYASGNAFRQLAGYIFGNNNEEQKIAMTSPVRMHTVKDSMQMSFVMPEKYSLNDLPKPTNSGIDLHSTDEPCVAVIRFGGYMNERIISQKLNELRSILDEKRIMYDDQYEFLGYNAPYEFVNRTNEILIKISPEELKKINIDP